MIISILKAINLHTALHVNDKFGFLNSKIS